MPASPLRPSGESGPRLMRWAARVHDALEVRLGEGHNSARRQGGRCYQGRCQPPDFRNPANVRPELREARGTDALAWITTHTFRKTAATILDEAALSARLVADQLGHSRPSMTQDVYLGRRAVDSQAALALEAALRDTAAASESNGKTMANEEGQTP